MKKRSANQTEEEKEKKVSLNDFWDMQRILKTIKFVSHYNNSEDSLTGKEFRIGCAD